MKTKIVLEIETPTILQLEEVDQALRDAIDSLDPCVKVSREFSNNLNSDQKRQYESFYLKRIISDSEELNEE